MAYDFSSSASLEALAGQLGLSLEALIVIFIAVLLWKLIWYGLALFRTIEKKHKAWFVVLFVSVFLLNDLGILAIIYLFITRNKKKKSKKDKEEDKEKFKKKKK